MVGTIEDEKARSDDVGMLEGFVTFKGLEKENRKDTKRKELRTLDIHESIMALLIGLSYMCFVSARVFIAAIAPAMDTEDSRLDYSLEKHGDLLVVVGVVYGISKLVNGAIVDATNPKYCYIIYISVSAFAALMVTLVHVIVPDDADQDKKYRFLLGIGALNASVQSGGWPALAKYIYFNFRPAQYGRVFSFLSIGSRLGSLFTSLIIGAALLGMTWQNATRIVVAITLVALPLFLGVDFVKARSIKSCDRCRTLHAVDHEDFNSRKSKFDSPAPPRKIISKPYKFFQQLSKYGSWWVDSQFVRFAVSFGLLGLMASVEGFLPLLISSTVNPGASTSTLMSSLVPMGIVTSILFGGSVLETFSRRGRASATLFMMGMLFLSSAAFTCWAIAAERNDSNKAYLTSLGLILSLYGFFLGYPYYIPPSVFALHYGGEDGAMVTAMFDTLTAGLSALLASFGSDLADVSFGLLTGVLTIASAVSWYLLRQYHMREKRKVDDRKAGRTPPITDGPHHNHGLFPRPVISKKDAYLVGIWSGIFLVLVIISLFLHLYFSGETLSTILFGRTGPGVR